ncbi:hypothetical protein PRZ48_007508 [Zasmidium cellare]|uniref:Uncharacterized protein n=1 Tax=Zasmidium cellare TaxID=395010 RepID=A0ABR0EJH9_ZASCE|nr:hypothetical protein PRZ48_007508 [Zasmidium cellare]
MADQAKKATSGAQEKTQNATKGTPVSGAQEKVKTATDSALGSIQNIGNKVAAKGQSVIDSMFPPEKRAAFLAKLQSFMLANPKLSAFLGMNIALTGVPLGLFILFSIVVFITALVIALVVALLAAVIFTLFCVGTALVIVFPAVLFTTGAACFLFLWGLGGYYILKWANGAESKEGSQQPGEGSSIGDSLSRLTGGKLDGFMEGARAQNAKKDISGYSDRFTKPQGQPEGQETGTTQNGAPESKKEVGDSNDQKTGAGSTNPAADTSNAVNSTKSSVGAVSG